MERTKSELVRTRFDDRESEFRDWEGSIWSWAGVGEDDPSSCMKEGKRGVEPALQEGLVPFDATEGTHTRRSSASGSSLPLLQPNPLGANTTDRVRSDQLAARVRETKKRDRSNSPLSPAAQPRLPLPNTSEKPLKRELPG